MTLLETLDLIDKIDPDNSTVKQVRALIKENEGLKALRDGGAGLWEAENSHLREQRDALLAENQRIRRVIDDYAFHADECILNQRSAGEPTPNGGYRVAYNGVWYETRPVDKTPKCDCGFDDALKALEDRK